MVMTLCEDQPRAALVEATTSTSGWTSPSTSRFVAPAGDVGALPRDCWIVT